MIFASPCSQLQAERKFRPATDYMSSLGTKFTSKHLKSSYDTLPYNLAFKFYSVTYFIYASVVKFKSVLIKAKNTAPCSAALKFLV
ncbi:hypothetical protein [Campylobacter concisus]|uniref:hypothetical protein n=1 Tax=Campylobacter concisus TaxID=199 RepID=UPI00131DF08C|nr:hypothetical protein [Campylobacter concisus]